ncbi:MAG: NAD-dependent deacylase [Rhodobacteraceae bacterium]|nr:NAD-dependent deacylase [Paracoccaceae bacterium]
MTGAPAIVVLTGAGISAESGLGTFRDTDGLWARFDPMRLATPEGFAADPAAVLDFYNARRANARNSGPNAAHFALARLETCKPGELLIVTQNVDDLHERAGSRAVIHMHGELARALCAACGARWEAPPVMRPEDPCPACGRPATRPDVVWFGEIPYRMEEIAAALAGCRSFVAIGTSGQVWPAAGFVEEARAAGARCLELNLERSEVSDRFHEVRLGRATDLVPAWVAEVLA